MSQRRLRNALLVGLPILLLSGTAGLAQQPQPGDAVKNLTPVTDVMLRNPPPGDWLMWRRTGVTARSIRSTKRTSRT